MFGLPLLRVGKKWQEPGIYDVANAQRLKEFEIPIGARFRSRVNLPVDVLEMGDRYIRRDFYFLALREKANQT